MCFNNALADGKPQSSTLLHTLVCLTNLASKITLENKRHILHTYALTRIGDGHFQVPGFQFRGYTYRVSRSRMLESIGDKIGDHLFNSDRVDSD